MESQGAKFWWIRWLSIVGLVMLLMALRDVEKSRLLLHFVGIAMVLAGVPFMKVRHVSYLMSIVLGTLIAEIFFRNIFAPPPLRHSGITPAWIGLACVYCAGFVLLGLRDRRLRQSESRPA